MYLLEYFKTNGRTITLQVETIKDLQDLIDTLIMDIEKGKLISFNVEVIHGNVRKD